MLEPLLTSFLRDNYCCLPLPTSGVQTGRGGRIAPEDTPDGGGILADKKGDKTKKVDQER